MNGFADKEPSLTDKVYKEIKEMIVYGQLKPGEALSVGEFADRFNVSKTPVREAFHFLKHDGLIDILPYKGGLVSQLNLKDLGELFTLRVLLEGGAAELAAIHATEPAIRKLESLVDVDISSLDQADGISIMKRNFDFHEAVAEAGNNLRLKKMIVHILDTMQRVLYLDLRIGSTFSMNDHRQLVDLIKQRDPAAAKKRMVDHITNTRNRILSTDFI
ncbi:GntR family transcriptional regulator [Gorillibacterium sp. sgz500922]|uniref:GntR family transcriptional regulator n=1 Tax=Gorillibacterium sp. sgz500922 TaxID=3446694 RepID=UPI003F679055